jgi:hypothetical protein
MTQFVLLTMYGDSDNRMPMTEWDPADAQAHLDHLTALNDELRKSGELVDMRALSAPEQARIVRYGETAPVVTDGPFPETKEFLAGWQLVDVDSEERALEIAARTSQAPGPGGKPFGQPIEVRQVMFTYGEDA